MSRPRKKQLLPPVPEVGTRGEVRYGLYSLTCVVVQVAGEGMLVKVEVDPNQVPLGSEGAVYVFKREAEGRSYKRKAPGRIEWFLQFP
jgi:hypothetical protein